MKRILVIDDRDEVRSVIVASLTRAGYQVRGAKDGREGIQLVLAQKPDLILCDVNMPGFDGYRTLAAIRKCHGTAGISFILMTGSVSREDFRRGMVCGADDYIFKPFTPAELIQAVESRLTRRTDLETEFFGRAERPASDAVPQFA